FGDGTTGTGTVSGSTGSFTVTGTHLYLDELNSSYSVTVTKIDAGLTVGPVGNTVDVAEGDVLAVNGGANFNATEGTTFSGVVSSFTDTGYPGNSASDFTATIDWGDGTTTPGTVTGGAGTFNVSGTHLYTDEGTFNTTVTLADDAPGTAVAISHG